MALWLRDGKPFGPTPLPGVIMAPGEQGRAGGLVTYTRLYGVGDGSYRRNNIFAFGSPGFMATAFGLNALFNQYNTSQAQRDAKIQWRDHQLIMASVTNQRVITHLADGRLLDFALSRTRASTSTCTAGRSSWSLPGMSRRWVWSEWELRWWRYGSHTARTARPGSTTRLRSCDEDPPHRARQRGTAAGGGGMINMPNERPPHDPDSWTDFFCQLHQVCLVGGAIGRVLGIIMLIAYCR
jgi:hypothetical protein